MSRIKLPTDREPTEHEEQRHFVSWFRQSFEGVRIYAVPNGGKRGKREAQKLKTEGVTAGVPDLEVPAWRLHIEMKRQKTGRASAEQKDWIDYLNSCGCTAFVAKGSADAQRQVLEFLRSSERGPHLEKFASVSIRHD